jgi:uncharacterized membrane protein YgcG
MSIFEGKHIFIRRGLAFVALLVLTGIAAADERILDYHADVSIQRDGSLMVAETIRVRAEGRDIRRGIYRDFPTRYEDRFGNRYRVAFSVLDVQRNGSPEAFHTEQRANGVRVYMGSAQSLLDQGVHEYRLRYLTRRQLGFFEDYDELYWNVTGNGWMFPIDQASARVELPAPVDWESLQTALYTGNQGSAEKYAESNITSARTIEFQTTRGLAPRQGLTIAVSWPKGIVHEPTTAERMGYFFKDNSAAVVLLIGLLAPLLWYLRSWHYHGRDPRKGVIIPRFEPPKGLSAAGCKYVKDMGLRNDAFTAAVISLGVKGYLKIDEKDDEYVLYRLKGPKVDTATKGEAAVLMELLPEESSWIELDNENHSDFQRARSGLKAALASEHQGRLFKLNTIFMAPAVIMSILAAVIATQLQGGPAPWIVFGILTVVLHLAFLFLMRAPTPAGRLIMDEIEGFEMYLNTAEQDRLDRMRSPDLTPEVFETFLPFAFALGVENNWCKRFANEFPRDVAEGGSYRTGWYSGRRSGLRALNHLGDNFGSSFSGAISSASTPPGSSSGSGGGGSSGGGGGGGGGGGW